MSLIVDIKKQFCDFYLNVSFSSDDGVTGILGASGCGKSVTLKCIAGIITPDEGKIILNGRVLFDSSKNINIPAQERNVGYLFQHYALFPNMTVEQNIRAGLRKGNNDDVFVEQLLEDYQLTALRKKYPKQLSGGQQQRVALARILAGKPEVLLLDEPFSALDSYLKWQVSQKILDVIARFQGITLLVTHDKEEVQCLCNNACVLNQGQSQELQTVHDLFGQPKTVAACLLTGCKNISRIQRIDESTWEAVDWGGIIYESSRLSQGITHVGLKDDKIKLYSQPKTNCILCSAERILQISAKNRITVLGREMVGGRKIQFDIALREWPKQIDSNCFWLELPQKDLLPLQA